MVGREKRDGERLAGQESEREESKDGTVAGKGELEKFRTSLSSLH